MSETASPPRGAAAPTAPRNPIVKGRTDASAMVGRCLRLGRRNLDVLITSLLLPVILMLLFVYLFGGALDPGGGYVQYVVPGVLVLCAGFGSAATAVSVSQDLHGGIIDRLRSLDVGGAALLAGHVTASVLRNIVSTVLVFGVAFMIGFRSGAGPAGWLAAAGILLLFIVTICWLAALVGLLARSPEAANGFTFILIFLPYASSAFVPLDTMPSWLQGFSEHQPITPIIDSVRGLLNGTPVGDAPWTAITWCTGVLAVSMALSGLAFRHRTAA
jgi:ABC-2 type transport system permease protein